MQILGQWGRVTSEDGGLGPRESFLGSGRFRVRSAATADKMPQDF